MAAQSQKHVTHNEAIRALDAMVQLAVLDRDLAAPPGSPAEGARYIVGSSPTGAWSGHADEVAAYQDGAWMLYAPVEGWIAWIADEDVAVVLGRHHVERLDDGRRQRFWQLHDARHQRRHRRHDQPAVAERAGDAAQPRWRRAPVEDQQGGGRRHGEPALPGCVRRARRARPRRRRRFPFQGQPRRHELEGSDPHRPLQRRRDIPVHVPERRP